MRGGQDSSSSVGDARMCLCTNAPIQSFTLSADCARGGVLRSFSVYCAGMLLGKKGERHGRGVLALCVHACVQG